MTVCVARSDSILPQHIHMKTPGLPVFCSAAPTLVPVKVRSTWWWDEPGKALLSDHVAGFLMYACKFICLYAFLFAYVCMRHIPRRSWSSREFWNDVHTLVQFYEDHTSPFLTVKYVSASVHCILSDLLETIMHQHDSVFMWFRVLRWCFSNTKVHGDFRWALLDFLGRVTCDVYTCPSQLHCAGSIAVTIHAHDSTFMWWREWDREREIERETWKNIQVLFIMNR